MGMGTGLESAGGILWLWIEGGKIKKYIISF
jgi:hypothetical protein